MNTLQWAATAFAIFICGMAAGWLMADYKAWSSWSAWKHRRGDETEEDPIVTENFRLADKIHDLEIEVEREKANTDFWRKQSQLQGARNVELMEKSEARLTGMCSLVNRLTKIDELSPAARAAEQKDIDRELRTLLNS